MAGSKMTPRVGRRLGILAVAFVMVSGGVVLALWFAAPGLLARKAAHRASAASGVLLLDHVPLATGTLLFYSDTLKGSVSQRQLRMAFRGAAGTLENQLDSPPTVVRVVDVGGFERLCAYWQFSNGYVELLTGSGNDSDWTTLRAAAGTRPGDVKAKPATIDDVKTIYVR